ncbi:MAG: rRNA pseudouridine synthase [Clostridia bacterium]|nr:rRNA pseudouridine synthase [Clostridia bacterium]
MRKTQRLDKILANFGFGTRKEIKQAVKNGIVRVDGVAANDSGMHVDPESSAIEVNGEVLNYRKYIYLMMNKPQGVISATFDLKHRTVADLLPEEYRHFEAFPVGRLDIDTEGLLIMTNDGQLAHELLSPKRHVPKRYYALVEGCVNDMDISAFKCGIILDDGYKTLPAELTIIKAGEYSETEVVIMEGKFHQVKRMFEAVGKRVKFLKRLQMGGLKLDNSLAPGQVRELTAQELNSLKNKQEGAL